MHSRDMISETRIVIACDLDRFMGGAAKGIGLIGWLIDQACMVHLQSRGGLLSFVPPGPQIEPANGDWSHPLFRLAIFAAPKSN
jgi:hypothetical protein